MLPHASSVIQITRIQSHQFSGPCRHCHCRQDLLSSLGVRLDCASAVIRQAAVTRLADANSPEMVSRVVAEASGLARWVAAGASG
jgi:hypothetical protein